MLRIRFALRFMLSVAVFIAARTSAASPAAVNYYVSSSAGNDNNNGLSAGNAFATIGKVNSLNLQPGDRVLLKCGDVWRAEQLVLSKSGTELAPIVIRSYPEGCANKPILSGSRSIGGWVHDSGSVYRADLSQADFPLGINQLFRNGHRLTLGRWPNLNDPNGGYAFVKAHTTGGNQITDDQLPAIDWSGAIVHIKNIRWSMLERQVTGTSGHGLTLNQNLSCLISSWGSCAGWGYFINHHRATLDQDGEWYYNATTRQVFLYSASGAPSNIEGSVIQEAATTLRHGGLMLSNGAAIAYVVVDNLEIKNWFNHGIGTPGSMSGDIYHHLTVRHVTIKDVDNAGVNLSSWLERPSNGRKGLRGGDHLTFTNNVIDGANSFGITGYFAASTFEDNTIKNIALIRNLGKSGMSCGITADECTENGDGFRIRQFDVRDSGYGNTLRYNRFEKIGYNGVDIFGPDITLEKNFFTQTCYSKADCGAVRTYGGASLAATTVYNVRLLDNIVVDIPGNVDGCHASRAAFGMGLYIDHYSRDVETRGNTIISTTITGILYQRSTGQIVGNTVFDASTGTEYSAHISLSGAETRATISHNALYGLNNEAWTLYARSLSNFLASDYNYLFHPYVDKHIAYGPSWTRYNFADWKSFSSWENHSRTNWFTQSAGEPSRGIIVYNATRNPLAVNLGYRQYLDLDQHPVMSSVTLAPFTSRILVDNGPAPVTLYAISPALADVDEPTAFVLAVQGAAFTASSSVRWNGSARPTTFISSSQLTATVFATDVNTLGDFPVTIYDPAPVPTGTLTSPMMFHVVSEVFTVYLPLIAR